MPVVYNNENKKPQDESGMEAEMLYNEGSPFFYKAVERYDLLNQLCNKESSYNLPYAAMAKVRQNTPASSNLMHLNVVAGNVVRETSSKNYLFLFQILKEISERVILT